MRAQWHTAAALLRALFSAVPNARVRVAPGRARSRCPTDQLMELHNGVTMLRAYRMALAERRGRGSPELATSRLGRPVQDTRRLWSQSRRGDTHSVTHPILRSST